MTQMTRIATNRNANCGKPMLATWVSFLLVPGED